MIEHLTTCYHCGDDCLDNDIISDDKSFCCEGCRTVYGLLNDNNLCQYYSLESRPGISPDTLTLSGRYSWLDQPEIANGLLEFKHGSRCHVTLSTPGMHCSSCIWLLEHLNRLDAGVYRSTVNFPARKVSIEYDSEKTTLRNIVEWLVRIGYEPSFSQEDATSKSEKKQNRSALYKIGVAGFCFGNIMMLSLPDYFASGVFTQDVQLHRVFMALSVLLSLPVVFYAASDFFISAWKGLKGHYLNIDMPVSLAIAVTFLRSLYDWSTGTGTGYFDSMSGIVFFMLVGRFFQNKTWQRLSFDRDFRSYFPVAVTVRRQGAEAAVSVADIRVGDRMIIRNMELIPADSVLMSNDTLIDYSFVTGESVPVEQKNGDRIYAGGRLIGPISEMEVTREMEQSYLTRLWNNPVFKRSEQSDQTHYVEQINRWFTVITLLLAFAALGYWMPFDGTRAMNAFTAVLIIACPCALLMAATFTHGNMLRIFGLNGFYLRSAQVIERIAAATGILFDKTGTITHSQRTTLDWKGIDLNDDQKNDIAYLASQSAHPYSRLIARYWSIDKRGSLIQFEELPGEGLSAQINGSLIKIGSRKFTGAMSTDNSQDGTVWISLDDAVLGYFTVTQAYRTGLPELVSTLKSRFKLWLISGDNEKERVTLLPLFGESSVMYFNQTPEQKMNVVQTIQQEGHNVIMVGDGLNDSGALAQSNVGIAITDDLNRFSPACDAILDGSKLTNLATFIQYATKSRAIINLAFGVSLIYNVFGLAYAMSGTLSPVIAAIIMPIMSISIVALSTLSGSWIAYKLGLKITTPPPSEDFT